MLPSPIIENVNDCVTVGKLSGSVAVAVPTTVPGNEFSSTANVCACTVGGSFCSTTVTDIVAVSVKKVTPPPATSLSVTLNVNVYERLPLFISPIVDAVPDGAVDPPAGAFPRGAICNCAARVVGGIASS